MTENQLKKYFGHTAATAGIQADDLDSYLDIVIEMGLNDFWNAKGWSFRTREFSHVITAALGEAEAYDLPADFIGFQSVREKESLAGKDLTYWEKKRFDAYVAKPTAYSSTFPQAFTVYYDRGAKAWRVKYFPIPEVGHTMFWDIYTNKASSTDQVPDAFVGGLTMTIEKYLYPLASQQKVLAMGALREEILRLERMDTPFKGYLFKIGDDTDVQINVNRPWI